MSSDDISFLETIEIYDKGLNFANNYKKSRRALTHLKDIINGKSLTQLVSENNTKLIERMSCDLIDEMTN